MLNDYSLLILARERQAHIGRDVANLRMRPATLARVAVLAACVASAIAGAHSGDRTGTFAGVVVDNRNRPVPGAAVLLTAAARRCTTKTDDAGRFSLSCISSAGYTGRVHKAGFADSVLPNIGVVAGAAGDVGVVLLTPN